MHYRYRAIDATGRRVDGHLEAADPADLETRLTRLRLDLLHARAIAPPRANNAIARRKLLDFWFQLKELLRVGVPLQAALGDLRDTHDDPVKSVAAQLLDGIVAGQTLSQAMAAQTGVFRPVFVSLIRAGETAGELVRVMEDMIATLKWEDELVAKTQKLLLYPAFVASVVLAASVFLLLYLVPQLQTFLQQMGETLPVYTRLLFWLSDVLRRYGVWLLPAMPLALIAVSLFFRHAAARQRRDALLLALPLAGDMLCKIALSRFAALFALLYAAGIPVLEALGVTREAIGNRVIRQALATSEQAIREGRALSVAFADTGFFPPFVVRMLHVGETTGALDTALANVRYFYNRDVETAVGRAERLIEPLLTLLLGALLGWVMLAVVGPVYEVVSHVSF
ncbi:MAG: type II secretion system F family protein [Zoogloeaceae bacterium]|jgi:type IV pilus assembly protein PilC|nr:type II secretion system F family protein [Zoogloeaceae bacterium]